MGNENFERARVTAEATATLDKSKVSEADGSAAARITPMLNTINHLDLSQNETWFGHGVDYAIKHKSNSMASDITDYGFIAYIVSLGLVFSCCIPFFSLATIMFLIGIGGGTGNITYIWSLLMIFAGLKYFTELDKAGELYIDIEVDDEEEDFEKEIDEEEDLKELGS